MSSVKCNCAFMFGFIFSLVIILDTVVVFTSAQNCSQLSKQGKSYCEDEFVINYPFWYEGIHFDSKFEYSDNYCGYPGFGIRCEARETITVMNISNQLYRASNINYQKQLVRVKEMDLEGEECPHQRQNLSLQEFGSSLKIQNEGAEWMLFYNCSSLTNYIKSDEEHHLGCLDNSGRLSYAFPFGIPIGYRSYNWYKNCEETLVVPRSIGSVYGISNANYTEACKEGFSLTWSTPIGDCKNCESSGGLCSYYRDGGFRKCSCGSEEFDKTCPAQNKGGSSGPSPLQAPSSLSVGVSPRVAPSNQLTLKPNHREKGLSTEVKVFIGVCTGVGVLLLLVLLIYRRILFSIYKVFASHLRNNVKGRPMDVEMFLESCRHLNVRRYKYSDIKKMTNSFKETLGKGGYGSVFKGKLKDDGRLVAVKLLNEAKGNGEDFINEVTTIGRTNHVNVVSLLGFCTERTKRALVYEFMPNGSLEKFIYNEKRSTTPLGWEKLYEIALGIARGLEYLHRGCNTRILHFDIKPHNILLDQNFCPKISDFGLAKLCPTRESVVSMLGARGTIGYIAPEVYCRNFGGVSHKSDVYSYGMMVLEIVGGRKNIDATVENISEIYFPQWIYNHLKQGVNLEGSEEIFEDETTRKMILVALWCIQRQPADRPSINKVVEMLEGSTEELQMPPNPFEDFPSSSS